MARFRDKASLLYVPLVRNYDEIVHERVFYTHMLYDFLDLCFRTAKQIQTLMTEIIKIAINGATIDMNRPGSGVSSEM